MDNQGLGREPLLLSRESAALSQNGKTDLVEASVYYTMSLGPSFWLEYDVGVADSVTEGPVEVALQTTGVQFKGSAGQIDFQFSVQTGHGFTKRTVTPLHEPVPVSQSTDLVRVDFALANGDEFFMQRKVKGFGARQK